MDDLSPREKVIYRIGSEHMLGHQLLFRHRHPQATPIFHKELIEDWHAPIKNILDLVFRGGAKSTIAEEAITVKALFRRFRNGLIVGNSYDRAAARLHAIRREFETNPLIHELFGDLQGRPWGDDKIELKTGVVIQALGKGQSLRGIKELDQRPDLLFVDDLEDRQDVSKPEMRQKVRDWHDFDLIPACDPEYLQRMAATPLHPDALPMRLMRDPEWVTHKFPIYYLHPDTGVRTSTWPERFPMSWIDKSEKSAQSRGQISGWRAEYMCESEAPETKPFKKEMFRIEPRVRTWQAVYSMFDPARTVKETSATTGKATWSWIGPKLIIWDAWGRRLMPNEIVDEVFNDVEAYHPVWIGVEEDGLNQFLMQPIRLENVKRGVSAPIKAVKAPRSKLDFIRGLQVFFHAREVEFVKPMPDLEGQLLGFPTGDIDVPNALAYALKLRPGAPIYDDFGARHVAEDLQPTRGQPCWLILNATRTLLTGILVQAIDGSIRIFKDYVREGDPGSNVGDMIALAQLDAGRVVRLLGGPLHFDTYNNVGLRQALTRLQIDLERGAPSERGRPHLVNLLQRERYTMPMVMVSSQATWTLNAFSGGYSRALLKAGQLADFAEEGEYRVLMEGLESFAGRLSVGSPEEENDDRNYAVTADGRRYVSTLPQRGR
jgi:hypothetical protein